MKKTRRSKFTFYPSSRIAMSFLRVVKTRPEWRQFTTKLRSLKTKTSKLNFRRSKLIWRPTDLLRVKRWRSLSNPC